jgi:hypothetical protein
MQYRRLFFGGSLAVILAAPLIAGDDASMDQEKRVALRNHHQPMQLHRVRDQTTSESYNWSGYAVTGSTGSVTQVQASWVVPAVNCSETSGDGTNVYAAFWTGIDGWTSNTVEQIGTDSDCVSPSGTPATPTYYAWFEFYPQPGYYIGNPNNGFTGYIVAPGDSMSAEVTSSGSGGGPRGGQRFTVTITDETRGWTFTTSSTVPGARQSSAEWIAETPYGCSTSTEFCYLSDFGVVGYGLQNTGVAKTSYATVNGVMEPIGAFGKNLQQAIMVSDPGDVTMATPSALIDEGTSFSVSWFNAGP